MFITIVQYMACKLKYSSYYRSDITGYIKYNAILNAKKLQIITTNTIQ